MRGCFFVNCDTIDAKWATLEAFLVIFKALFVCLFVLKPDNFDLDIYYDGKKKKTLYWKKNQIKFVNFIIWIVYRIQRNIIQFFCKFLPPFDNIESITPAQSRSIKLHI